MYIIVLILVLLHLKYLVLLLVFPFQLMALPYFRGKRTLFAKLLYSPYYIIEKILNGGYQRWMLYQIGLFPSNHIRKYVYKLLGAKIGSDVVFHFRTELRCPTGLGVGHGTIIGDNVILDCRNNISIGSNVNISSNVSIYTQQHNYKTPEFHSYKPIDRRLDVVIGDRVWLGANVIVLPGVTIGEGAVCCAGCVVTKNVDPYAVVSGIPAKKISERPQNLTYTFNGKSCRLY